MHKIFKIASRRTTTAFLFLSLNMLRLCTRISYAYQVCIYNPKTQKFSRENFLHSIHKYLSTSSPSYSSKLTTYKALDKDSVNSDERTESKECNCANSDKSNYHIPVMKDECCEQLMIRENGLYIDCTMGGGGHTRAILEKGGKVIGLDQDSDAIKETGKQLSSYISSGRLEIIQTNFRHLEKAIKEKSRLAQENGGFADGILMDLGISSHQIDEPSRGFSYNFEGPLDMRMNQDSTSLFAAQSDLTAEMIVNEWSLERIANLLYDYGDEPRSRQIAREIVASRPIEKTSQLENLISRITFHKHRSKTLSRCFQAIRIVVNDEIGALNEALTSAHRCIRPGGRLVVLSYHSLEDARVKRLIKSGFPELRSPSNEKLFQSGNILRPIQRFAAEFRNCDQNNELPWNSVLRKAQTPTDEEILFNRRARSAKLRAAERSIFEHTESDPTWADLNIEAIIHQAYKYAGSTKKQKYNPAVKGKKQRIKEDSIEDSEAEMK